MKKAATKNPNFGTLNIPAIFTNHFFLNLPLGGINGYKKKDKTIIGPIRRMRRLAGWGR